jgi:hypothetical protein
MKEFVIEYTDCITDSQFIYPSIEDCIIEADSEEEAKAKFKQEYQNSKIHLREIDSISPINSG